LCEAVNRHLAQPISSADIVWSFAGVRPLYDDAQSDPSAVSREYELAVDAPPGTAPLLSVIGGKITAYRQVAEHALRLLAPHFPHLGAAWTAHAPLPGGSMAAERLEAYVERLTAAHDWLDAELAWRWVRAYGTRVERLLDDVADRDALGHHFGGGLFEREVQYLRAQEWARTAEDILWRRSKLGLFLTAAEQQGLAQWLAAHPAPTAATRHDTGPGPAQSSTAR
ncbi:MAG: glycerol-3-phosphate dehydrogenase, partial [Gammaproteobacteria bacterium]|nr:glycerol-3-phosphate dehydrogenase [Gammaproteobacteria bacterium]NIT64594.1 glycerol-3-phosphate dehydrogenase [Gammaproteobacteria bacterium]NIV21561.1 glycerol-3-phosphate dehydrogenase [Gammaproteobacteria bacterium]NIY33174.1 glycerol-3-phosphate dehydrogenase [Gammaproteobacteria bacterium]